MKKNIKLKPADLMSYVAGGSLGLLFVLTLAMLMPSTHYTALATCATGDSSELCVSSQAATELSVNLQTAISVALENQVNLEITPTSSGATGYSSAKLSVSTNSNEGYGIFLSTSTPNGDLLSTSSNNEAVISNTDLSNAPLTGLAKNSYGYALDSTPTSDTTKYSHIPTASTAVRTTNSVTASGEDYAYGDTYYLSFGAKIGTDIPAGSYSGAVTVSAVANPRTIAYLSDLTYMQDMTSDICTNTREGYTKQLIDTRDGKSYWVAKLKDGNCWMTQNLALDLSTDKALTQEDSDVSGSWTPKASTNAYGLYYDDVSGEVYGYASWNIGKTVVATPLTEHDSTCEAWGSNLGYDNGKFTINIADTCSSNGLIDVSDPAWQPTFVAQPGNFNGKSYTLVAVNESNQTYDAHYLLGNYYQFFVAVLGSISRYSNNDSAAYSICPKGWQLPNSGVTNDFKPLGKDRSFYDLLIAYGYPPNNNWNGLNTPILNFGSNSEINPLAPPMYLVSGGEADLVDGSIWGAGDYATIWSNTVFKAGSSQSIYPSGLTIFDKTIRLNNDMYTPGYNVRCVAQ